MGHLSWSFITMYVDLYVEKAVSKTVHQIKCWFMLLTYSNETWDDICICNIFEHFRPLFSSKLVAMARHIGTATQQEKYMKYWCCWTTIRECLYINIYHRGNKQKQCKLASLIQSRRPSDRNGCYFILPPRLSKIQEKPDILEVNQNVPQ